MKPDDKVTVMICVHSQDILHDRLLQRALESLVRQTDDRFQTMIVLDECWEDTISIVKAYKDVLDIRIHTRLRKQGLAAAKNFGIQRCETEWIAYLDADDEWCDNKLERQREYLEENPDVELCFTQAFDRHEDDSLTDNCFTLGQYATHEQIAERLPHENCLAHGSAMIDMNIFKTIGCYPTDRQYLGMEDWVFWQMAMNAGCRFFNIPERLYIYSLGTSVSR